MIVLLVPTDKLVDDADIVIVGIGAAVTVTVAWAWTELSALSFAIIVAVPAEIPVTLPVASTVATAVFPLDHTIDLSVNDAANTVAAIVWLAPVKIFIVVGFNVIDFWSVTVTWWVASIALLTSEVAVIVEFPGATPVTLQFA